MLASYYTLALRAQARQKPRQKPREYRTHRIRVSDSRSSLVTDARHFSARIGRAFLPSERRKSQGGARAATRRACEPKEIRPVTRPQAQRLPSLATRYAFDMADLSYAAARLRSSSGEINTLAQGHPPLAQG